MVTVAACLGLGGNIGDPQATMAAALRLIDGRADCDVVSASRLYRTPPWGKTDQPWFFNACATVATTLSPRDLLELCLETERSFKRERRERWGPRTLDLDVLDYGERPYEDDALILPHPRVTDRAFVLIPLAEIAPTLRIAGRTVTEWAAAADPEGIEPASVDGEWWREPGMPG
ncbi:2-amino-4-hydroxy-6-hydroxymethyldihydropteridine diphosphokinase [Aurantimonas endophytica]|uniref:2-amino-4-hydroxy-6- hydroxymethyldihydropteridine diphosphokinase n=1 Tax=Aurantimonas endophytica TaxID=1522175 RepID=UPI001AEF09A5|nr:2-amino-4-hydroxy-6-hydroxymethyldihydropteridine diphosphokinase [Aurantimonas endophytica]